VPFIEVPYTFTNAAPQQVAIIGPATGLQAHVLTFAGEVTDPEPGHTYTMHWQVHDSQGGLAGSGTGQTFPYFQPVAGAYTVTLTVTDEDGDVGTTTVPLTIQAVELQPDTNTPGLTQLVVVGTFGDDVIQVLPGGAAGTVTVLINGVNEGTFAPTGRLLAVGLPGNDILAVHPFVSLPSWLYGQTGSDLLGGGSGDDYLDGWEGNDVLYGGLGNDILLGWTGNDQLFGQGGFDLLFGGPGADYLADAPDEDILVAGFTAFDLLPAALDALRDEWTAARPLSARSQNIQGIPNPTFGQRLNGPFFLQTNVTVFDDLITDVVVGSAARDLIFVHLGPPVPDVLYTPGLWS
jgi:Ca2+-binding RTX toxin-like protein